MINADRPVAGQMFEGLTIINRTGLVGRPVPFASVRCDAQIGKERLSATKLAYGVPHRGGLTLVVCGWHIPANAAGKTLRLWKYGAGTAGHQAIVHIGGSVASSSGKFALRVERP